MKLCRFLVANRPGDPRTGVYHEGKIYETDGHTAEGIHDPANIVFLSPIGTPPAVRLFDSFENIAGESLLSYYFMNPNQLKGTNETLGFPPQVEQLGIEIRICGVLQDGDQMIEPAEAEKYLLGYALMLCFVDQSLQEEADHHPAIWTEAHDIGAILSPLLVTPEELSEYLVRETKSSFQWIYNLYINEEPILEDRVFAHDVSFYDLLQRASVRSAMSTGEVVAWPPLPLPDLTATSLGRPIEPGDKVRVVVQGLGAITSTIG
jgi:2-keto-4-pentenoate hydratase/2-oxohepta-3-ene-1,7-dioic acid hydratase in catechol pathway